MKKRASINLIIVFAVTLISACKKDWLDKKNDIHLIVPTTLSDMRLLLNDDYTMNSMNCGDLETSADNYDITTAVWQSAPLYLQTESTWQKDPFAGLSTYAAWDNNYKQVFTANVVLEGLNNIKPDASSQAEWNDIKGGALFHRANTFYTLLQLFAKPYNAQTASSDLGIPIRIQSDITIPTTRATIKASYDQVIADLQQSLTLLKITPTYKEDGSVPGADGMLARVYLAMGNYTMAYKYADNCLKLYPALIDYNTLNAAASAPLTRFNSETIFYSQAGRPSIISNDYVDTTLYRSYDVNDLRKSIFFKSIGNGTFSFKGSYTSSSTMFCGVATDEIYLIRAECSARMGNTADAMNDLNTLMKDRFVTGTFTNLSAPTSDAALSLILNERRKELLYRCSRWQDLRRLNFDSEYAVTLTRNVNNQVYTLPPNDQRYTLPIPDYIIAASGIAQNPR